jgi:hypothetical protein
MFCVGAKGYSGSEAKVVDLVMYNDKDYACRDATKICQEAGVHIWGRRLAISWRVVGKRVWSEIDTDADGCGLNG